MQKILIAAAVVIIGATGAQAADMAARTYTKAPMMAQVYNWTGFYAGVNAGAIWQQSDSAFLVGPGGPGGPGASILTANLAAIGAAGTGQNNRTNFIGGGQIGYNWQAMGTAWVWGLEADFSGIAGGRGRSVTAPFPTAPGNAFTVTTSSGYDWLLTARARVGYAFDKSMIYATGGLAVAELKASSSYVDNFPPPAVGSNSSSVTKAGWTVGAGWEYAVAPSWTVKAEYLYLHFGSVGGGYAIAAPGFNANPATYNSTFDENHIVRVGLNYKLGGQAFARY